MKREDRHQWQEGIRAPSHRERRKTDKGLLCLLLLGTALSGSLDIDGRAQAARLLHDSVSLRAQAAAITAYHVAALDFVGDHLIEQSGHLVHATPTSRTLQSGGRSGRFAVLCWAAGDGGRVEAATG